MPGAVSIDPVTRIEGHLAIRLELENNQISAAFCAGEMFRGFETILKGRDPLDAQQITQRICGVCPVSHGTASVLAQDEAYGLEIPKNGRMLRNIILGANFIQSHIIHFYHLAALDFVDIAAITRYHGADPEMEQLKAWATAQLSSQTIHPAAPFLPRYEGDYLTDTEINIGAIKHYLQALEMRRLAHKLGAVFAGKLPHAASIVPGGATEKVTAHKIAACRSMLSKLKNFIDHVYLPDVLTVAAAFPHYFEIGKGCGNFMAYGVFPEASDPSQKLLPGGLLIDGQPAVFNADKISEDVKHSKYSAASGLHPKKGQTKPDPHKNGAYSWLKAPRYDGQVVEVGPLARMLVAYTDGSNPAVKSLVDNALAILGRDASALVSVMGRHAARALECKLVADQMERWLSALKPGRSAFSDFKISATGHGVGLTEAPRGALGHWLTIENHKIASYQCVVPTTWNCSPRDDKDRPGPVEQALLGTLVADEKNPLEATRIVRSFDPCIACAVH